MSRGSRILIVEDSETQALKLRELLEREAWDVVTAQDAEQALEEINRRVPDLVILDFWLPGIRGDELCQRIRMNINTRGIPILMMTAEDQGQSEVHALAGGADDYVSKSDDDDILLIRVRSLLRKSRRQMSVLGPTDAYFRQARILAIDDSRTYLEYLTEELKAEGYLVENAPSGPDGLALLERRGFDCILLDLMMPEMDGIEVCRRIHEIRYRMSDPVVVLMLTAHETKDDMTRGLDAGADDFVGKSSDIGVVKGRVRALLRRKFFQEENLRIIEELKNKEMETLRARLEKEAADGRAAIADRLRETGAELEWANKELEAFTYSVSHDLRAPLRVADGFSRILIEDYAGQLDSEGLRMLAVIREHMQKMGDLIDDLLTLSRLGRKELQKKPVDMTAQARDAVEEMRWQENGAHVDARVGDLPRIQGDPALIKQVWINLISNAFKYTRRAAAPQVEISADAGERETVFRVRDNGAGFDMKYVHKLFGVFQSLHPADEFEGTGVGLAIVQRVIHRHGGRVWAEGELNKGATFYFALPLEGA